MSKNQGSDFSKYLKKQKQTLTERHTTPISPDDKAFIKAHPEFDVNAYFRDCLAQLKAKLTKAA